MKNLSILLLPMLALASGCQPSNDVSHPKPLSSTDLISRFSVEYLSFETGNPSVIVTSDVKYDDQKRLTTLVAKTYHIDTVGNSNYYQTDSTVYRYSTSAIHLEKTSTTVDGANDAQTTDFFLNASGDRVDSSIIIFEPGQMSMYSYRDKLFYEGGNLIRREEYLDNDSLRSIWVGHYSPNGRTTDSTTGFSGDGSLSSEVSFFYTYSGESAQPTLDAMGSSMNRLAAFAWITFTGAIQDNGSLMSKVDVSEDIGVHTVQSVNKLDSLGRLYERNDHDTHNGDTRVKIVYGNP